MSRGTTKEAELVVKTALSLLRSYFSVFTEFGRQIRSGGLLLFGSGTLALGRAGVGVLLLLMRRAFARLVFGIVSRRSRCSGFVGNFMVLSPVSYVDGLHEFHETG